MLIDKQLENRLEILLSSGTISSAADETVKTVAKRLEEKWEIILNEENGSRFVTHLAMALTRAEKGELVSSMEAEALEEFQELESFSKANEIVQDLLSIIGASFPESEIEFLVVNICLILEDE